MKDYTIKYKEQKNKNSFIKDFAIDEAENMKIYIADGRTIVVPYNTQNLEKIRSIMIEQAKNAQKFLPEKRNKKIIYKTLAVAGVAGLVLVNTTDFGKEINPIISNSALCGFTLLTGTGSLINSQFVTDIRKLSLFIKNRTTINEAITNNPYMYANINRLDKMKIERWKETYGVEPLVIENMDEISYKTIKTIWDNIKLSEELDLDYTPENKENGFQKTKKKQTINGTN